jgi:hypothetical protein
MNLTTNKWSSTWQNQQLQKQTLSKTYICKGNKKKSINVENLNQTHYSYYEKKDNKHTMLYLYGTKDLT